VQTRQGEAISDWESPPASNRPKPPASVKLNGSGPLSRTAGPVIGPKRWARPALAQSGWNRD